MSTISFSLMLNKCHSTMLPWWKDINCIFRLNQPFLLLPFADTSWTKPSFECSKCPKRLFSSDCWVVVDVTVLLPFSWVTLSWLLPPRVVSTVLSSVLAIFSNKRKFIWVFPCAYFIERSVLSFILPIIYLRCNFDPISNHHRLLFRLHLWTSSPYRYCFRRL